MVGDFQKWLDHQLNRAAYEERSMRREAKKPPQSNQTPSLTAVVALCLSAMTALFSGYQWWHNQLENRIGATIELSNVYLRDPELVGEQRVISNMIAPEYKASDEDRALAYHYMRRLQYIAHLANTERLDAEYLSSTIKCDIAVAPELMGILVSLHSMKLDPAGDIQKAATAFAASCDEK
jgi:hypothetical protein